MTENKPNRRAPRACACCFVTPIVLILALFIAFKIDNTDPQIRLPTQSMPEDNARDYFLRAAAAAKLMKHKSPYDMSGSPEQSYTLANFQGCAVDAEPALKIMREGLRHEYMNRADRSAKSNTFPIFAECRELERVNSGAADYYAVSGNPGRAMQMRMDGMEMGVMVPRGGTLIAGLVGIACEAIALSEIEPLIPKLSSNELEQAAERLEQIEAKRVPYSDVIQEEDYSWTAQFVEALKDSKIKSPGAMADFAGTLGSSDDNAKVESSKRMSGILAELGFVLANKQAMLRTNLEWYAQMSKEAHGPYTGPSKVDVPNNLIAHSLGETFTDARSKFANMQAVSAVLRVELALYRYRMDHGKFPAAFSQLAPAYLRVVPNDPCGGASLRYSQKNGGGGFLLYSIGTNLKDDGGLPGRFPGDANTDIVAGKMWHKKPIIYTGKPVKL